MLNAPRQNVGDDKRSLYNTVFWMADREGNLPHWLVGSDQMRVVSVPMPSHPDRKLLTRDASRPARHASR